MADTNYPLPAGATKNIPSDGAKGTPVKINGYEADVAEDAGESKRSAAVPYA